LISIICRWFKVGQHVKEFRTARMRFKETFQVSRHFAPLNFEHPLKMTYFQMC
jgi:hypothetical protein